MRFDSITAFMAEIRQPCAQNVLIALIVMETIASDTIAIVLFLRAS